MSAISPTSNSPAFVPLSGEATVTTDKAAPVQTLFQTPELLAAELQARGTVDLPLQNPGPPPTPAEVAAALDNIRRLGPENVLIDIFTVLALFQKFAQESRNGARIERAAMSQAEVTSLLSAAGEMRKAAEDNFKAAVIDAVAKIFSGAMNVGGALMASGKNEAAAKKTMGMASGIGEIVSGAMGVVSATYRKSAAEHEAKKSENEAAAKVSGTGNQHANDLMQQMTEWIKAIKEALQTIQQSSSDTTKTVAHNI